VLKVGSWNVTGTVREFFQSCGYLGVNVAEGPTVDLVASGESLALPTGSNPWRGLGDKLRGPCGDWR
jgi:hypothetical protein